MITKVRCENCGKIIGISEEFIQLTYCLKCKSHMIDCSDNPDYCGEMNHCENHTKLLEFLLNTEEEFYYE